MRGLQPDSVDHSPAPALLCKSPQTTTNAVQIITASLGVPRQCTIGVLWVVMVWLLDIFAVWDGNSVSGSQQVVDSMEARCDSHLSDITQCPRTSIRLFSYFCFNNFNKMKYFSSILFSAASVAAFPSYWAQQLDKVQPGVLESEQIKRAVEHLQENRAVDETNCGPVPCTVFNEKEQFVSIDGEHAFVAPISGDLRGPCPGLNAAANHGYSE